MRPILHGSFWVGIYLVISGAPLFVLLVGATPPGRGFWRELSVALGFLGLSMMGWQFYLTGRFTSITSPYGIDVVYHFHRLVSLIAFSFLVLHPVILLASSPATGGLLVSTASPWWMVAGVGGLLGFAVVIATTLLRARAGLSYERWRALHGYVSVAAVALSLGHVVGVNYYVQAPPKRWLWICMGLAWVLALVHVRLVKPLLMRRRPYTVTRVERQRGNSWVLELSPEGHAGMSFRPGQFAWLTMGKSPFAIREHPFSLSSSAMNPGRLEMTIKELGDFTRRIGATAPGTRAYLDGPYGSFTIDRHPAPGYVLIAGGVGIAPVMSIMRTMRDRGDRRPVVLFYGIRRWEDATHREEIAELGRGLRLKSVYVAEEAPDGWDGERGLVSAEIMARHLPEERMDFQYFVCGPRLMQVAVKQALDELGLPLERVQSESFNFV